MNSKLLAEAATRADRYASAINNRRVAPSPEDIARLDGLGGALNEDPGDPSELIAQLDNCGSPATIASTGPRYFGFVTGGSLPAAMAANWLAGAWDQNAALFAQSPVASRIEEIASGWLLDVLALPNACGIGFVTGATMANFTALAAARHALLSRAGWDVEERGLFGAPEITVVVGAEVHASMMKALSMLGFGRKRVVTVPADDQGRMIVSLVPRLDGRTLVAIQAGNVNTGAFDPAAEICTRARENGAWVHVDGAFGLWAAAAPERAHLVTGFAEADSWATDCHKWLNVPYDSGLAIVRDPEHLRAAMTVRAAYLQMGEHREPWQYTPEASRRARGIEIWAALRSLGRSGLAEMIERNCRLASRFADGFREAGFPVLNDVVLNQVLVSFGDAEKTRRVIAEVQREGTCWCGGTEWHSHTAMRISVSSWATTAEDVDRSLCAILKIAQQRSQ
ncbi:MAG TPA: aminotransferase class V-fold PLP-dependent enzyme [Bryobacteraceae bacterium]|jgi:glutamate/tyrosine decarboxylase-like PLP-dependent enzyme|nr:aminotransferase class V-fold PLP-dependent enzyme [Bryobacteraceae bacterium]